MLPTPLNDLWHARRCHATTGSGSTGAHRLAQHDSSHLGKVPVLQAPDLHQALLHATEVAVWAAGWGQQHLSVMPLRPSTFKAFPTDAGCL